MTNLDNELNKAALLIKESRYVSVLTGAGISKESGIPTFREAQTGLWAQYEPEKLATVEGFMRDPALVWSWYEWRRDLVSNVEPNAGHIALVEMENLSKQFTLITQNVDGLHTRAGSKNVIEVHGNISRHKCLKSNHLAEDIPVGLKVPPLCHCGSQIRPDVVWFGEALDPQNLNAAYQAAEACDVFLVVGTSGLVQPAASLPYLAKRHGAQVIECNPERTPLTTDADIFLKGTAGNVLSKLSKQIESKLH